MFQGCFHLSKTFPARTPIRVAKLVPAEHSRTEKVASIVSKKFRGLLILSGRNQFGICFLYCRKLAAAFFKEIVACRLKSLARVAPSHCGELVGLAEMPKRGVIAIAVLPAHFQHVGKVGAAGKTGKRGDCPGLSRQIHATPPTPSGSQSRHCMIVE